MSYAPRDLALGEKVAERGESHATAIEPRGGILVARWARSRKRGGRQSFERGSRHLVHPGSARTLGGRAMPEEGGGVLG